MFGKKVRIIRLMGFDVHVDASWLLLAFLIVWTLAQGLFPFYYHFQMFPVVEAGRLAGCITARDVKKVPRDDWPRTTVGEIAQRCTDENTIQRDSDALQALMLMNRTGNTRLVVAEGAQVAGVLTLKDLLGFLSFKLDLEGEDSSGRGPFRDGMA